MIILVNKIKNNLVEEISNDVEIFINEYVGYMFRVNRGCMV